MLPKCSSNICDEGAPHTWINRDDKSFPLCEKHLQIIQLVYLSKEIRPHVWQVLPDEPYHGGHGSL